MVKVHQTEIFASWLRSLRDEMARSKILIRIRRLSLGNFGDVKSVGEGVSELRIDYGPGYRVYLRKKGDLFVILLAGGTKKTQASDILKAKRMAKESKDGA